VTKIDAMADRNKSRKSKSESRAPSKKVVSAVYYFGGVKVLPKPEIETLFAYGQTPDYEGIGT
jgi:hypothetical protein